MQACTERAEATRNQETRVQAGALTGAAFHRLAAAAKTAVDGVGIAVVQARIDAVDAETAVEERIVAVGRRTVGVNTVDGEETVMEDTGLEGSLGVGRRVG